MCSHTYIILQNFNITSFITFLSDSNLVGVEKVAVSALRVDAGCHPKHMATMEDVFPGQRLGLIPPCGLFMVKGWARAVAAFTVMSCYFERADFREAWLSMLKLADFSEI